MDHMYLRKICFAARNSRSRRECAQSGAFRAVGAASVSGARLAKAQKLVRGPSLCDVNASGRSCIDPNGGDSRSLVKLMHQQKASELMRERSECVSARASIQTEAMDGVGKIDAPTKG